MRIQVKPWPDDAVMIVAPRVNERVEPCRGSMVRANCRECAAELAPDSWTIDRAAQFTCGRPVRFFCLGCVSEYESPLSCHVVEDCRGGITKVIRGEYRGIPINPVLNPAFYRCPLDDRSDAEIATWWNVPYLVSYRAEDGFDSLGMSIWFENKPIGWRFDLLCLDGHVQTRPTLHGQFSDLMTAIGSALRLKEGLHGR